MLVDATHDALLFAVDEGLGGEVVDAVVKTPLDHLGVHLQRKRRGQIGREEGSRSWTITQR